MFALRGLALKLKLLKISIELNYRLKFSHFLFVNLLILFNPTAYFLHYACQQIICKVLRYELNQLNSRFVLLRSIICLCKIIIAMKDKFVGTLGQVLLRSMS